MMKTIDQSDFNQLFPYGRQLDQLIGEGVEWFTDDAREVIGVVGWNITRKIWSYVVLKRSQLGFFIVASIGEQFFNVQMVRAKCRLAME